jgi:hypothetical protein
MAEYLKQQAFHIQKERKKEKAENVSTEFLR